MPDRPDHSADQTPPSAVDGTGPRAPLEHADSDAVRRAEELLAERLGLAADAASSYLDGIAKATSTGLVVVALALVETGELPGPSTGHLRPEDPGHEGCPA